MVSGDHRRRIGGNLQLCVLRNPAKPDYWAISSILVVLLMR